MKVQVPDSAYLRLKAMARESGQTVPDVLAQAVDALYRQRFVDAANAAYARLRRNSRLWAQERRERAAWDATLADGLGEP